MNDIGEGEPATVNQIPGAVPGAPALTTRGGNGAVTLRWNAPANDGGASILSYDVRYRESGAQLGRLDGSRGRRHCTQHHHHGSDQCDVL